MENLDENKVKVPFNISDVPYPDSLYPLLSFHHFIIFAYSSSIIFIQSLFFLSTLRYAVSKLFGEELGRLYAWKQGLESVAMRIGWIKDFEKGKRLVLLFCVSLTRLLDNPSELKGSCYESYMRAMYLHYPIRS